MYKKWFFTLIVLALIPLRSHAQLFETVRMQLKSGAAAPLEANHFQKYWNTGIVFGGGLETSINEMIKVKWDAAFNSFIFNHEKWRKDLVSDLLRQGFDEAELEDLVVNGANRYILETSIAAKFFPVKTENINPFIEVGAGLLNMSTDDLLVGFGGPEFTTETVPYFIAGVGAEASYWSGFNLFGQVFYKYAFTKDENNLDLALDFNETFKKQETHLLAIEFGIIFDLK